MNAHSSCPSMVALSTFSRRNALSNRRLEAATANAMPAHAADIIDWRCPNLAQDRRLTLVVLRPRSDGPGVDGSNVRLVCCDLAAHLPATLRARTPPACDRADPSPELDERTGVALEPFGRSHDGGRVGDLRSWAKSDTPMAPSIECWPFGAQVNDWRTFFPSCSLG